MSPAHARRSPWYLTPVALAVAVVMAGAVAVQAERRPVHATAATTAVAAGTPVLSARRMPALVAAPVAGRRLAAAVEPVLEAGGGAACLEVRVDGVPVLSHGATAPMVPASIEKLVTASAALSILGPDRTLQTSVQAAAAPQDGVVDGDLWLVGGGDPLLMTDAFVPHLKHIPPERSDLGKLADAVVAAGVHEVRGRVLGDDSRFDAERYPPSWPVRFATEAESGPISALTVDRNLDAYPASRDVSKPAEHPAADPPGQAAAVFASLLQARGVHVAGGTASGAAPAGAATVASMPSAPVSAIVEEMLRESDNLAAELLTKEIGVVTAGAGTTAAGVAAVHADLVKRGVPVDGSEEVDGSGLSGLDRVTCAMVATVLQQAGPASPIVQGLPVAAKTGTLEKRFGSSPVAGRLRAKTGTLNQVTALAGTLTTAKGADLTFAYVLNIQPPARITDAQVDLQEALAAALDGYPSVPDPAALGPRP